MQTAEFAQISKFVCVFNVYGMSPQGAALWLLQPMGVSMKYFRLAVILAILLSLASVSYCLASVIAERIIP